MRGEASILAVLLLASGIAGCIGTDETPGPDTGETDATDPGDQRANTTVLDAFETNGCYEQLSLLPDTTSPAASELPEGFEPSGLAYVFAFSCEQSQANGTSGPEVTVVQTGLFVEPPSELRNEEAVGHAYPLTTVASGEPILGAFEAWDLGELREGNATVEVLEDTPAARAGHAIATTDEGTLHVYSSTAGPADSGDPGVVRFIGTEDGSVTGVADMEWTQAQVLRGEANYVTEGDTFGFTAPAGSGAVEHWFAEDYDFAWMYTPIEELG